MCPWSSARPSASRREGDTRPTAGGSEVDTEVPSRIALCVRCVVPNMRPEIDDDVAAAVDELVDDHTRVPVEHLTFNQRLGVLVEVTRDLEEDTSAASTTQNQYGGTPPGSAGGGFSR